jgi:uncharacterized DUF497 family protein
MPAKALRRHHSSPPETSSFHIAVTFDPEKNAKSIAERGLSFERVAEFDWDAALIAEDIRRDYGETRFLVMPRWLSTCGGCEASAVRICTSSASARQTNER